MIHAAAIETRLGVQWVAVGERGICVLGLDEERGRRLLGEWIERHAPGEPVCEDASRFTELAEHMRRWGEGEAVDFSGFALDLRGSDFQRDVWQALTRIPHGQTRTYAEVAEAVGRPKAVRAVGRANGANPVPLIVPCHRVVASSGLGGFSGGFDRKRRMLEIEGVLLPFF